jgi:hypothetical protein
MRCKIFCPFNSTPQKLRTLSFLQKKHILAAVILQYKFNTEHAFSYMFDTSDTVLAKTPVLHTKKLLKTKRVKKVKLLLGFF